MSTELESPKLELDIDSEEEDGLIENMEQEIECPRCYDIMTLSSDFDRVGIFLSRMRLVACDEIDIDLEKVENTIMGLETIQRKENEMINKISSSKWDVSPLERSTETIH